MVFHKRKKTLRIIVEKYSISGGFGQEVGGGGIGGGGGRQGLEGERGV